MKEHHAAPQKEIEELEGLAYEMEKRLIALKNAYAENADQKRDDRHAYGSHSLRLSPGLQKKIAVSLETRYHMIAKEAYFRSRRNGFDPHTLARDWQEAEQEVDRLLTGKEIELPPPHHDHSLHGHE